MYMYAVAKPTLLLEGDAEIARNKIIKLLDSAKPIGFFISEGVWLRRIDIRARLFEQHQMNPWCDQKRPLLPQLLYLPALRQLFCLHLSAASFQCGSLQGCVLVLKFMYKCLELSDFKLVLSNNLR